MLCPGRMHFSRWKDTTTHKFYLKKNGFNNIKYFLLIKVGNLDKIKYKTCSSYFTCFRICPCVFISSLTPSVKTCNASSLQNERKNIKLSVSKLLTGS